MVNKNQKGLGKGIEALFADNGVDPKEETVTDIVLTAITPNPYQPRQKFDQAALNDLAASIKKNRVFFNQSLFGNRILSENALRF